MTASTVHIVHCIDTEGPLHEPLGETFKRIKDIFGLELEATPENLQKLQNCELDLGGVEVDLAKVVSPELLAYHNNWDALDLMLADITSDSYRSQVRDSFGGAWIYNWFCLDFVGFQTNPRSRDAGFHRVFDHYREFPQVKLGGDGIHFHHHPLPFSGEGHHSATHYFSHAPIIFEILARRVLERDWFPCVNRPGFHTTRPDSNWLMEQFIPFDYANQSTDEINKTQNDLPEGRFGDWRRAPKTWTPYHPAHDDYQVEGNCRRWISRCLNIGSRIRLLTDDDIELAFREAEAGKPVVLSFTHHDFRDMRPAIEHVVEQLSQAATAHPDVPYRFCEAREAMRLALGMASTPPITFSINLDGNVFKVVSDKATFGPQPFLAIKTREGRYLHDNLDFQEPFSAWTYHFDQQTVPVAELKTVGVASCDETGNVSVSVFDVETGETRHTQY